MYILEGGNYMKTKVNEFNQQIGEEILAWEKREFPSKIEHVGKYTILEKLSKKHTKKLFEAYQQNVDHSNWTYLIYEPINDMATFDKFVDDCMNHSNRFYYAVLEKESGNPLGLFSLMRINQKDGVIEVGDVNFSDKMKRTRIATEAHYLLAKYVFEELQYRRYEWKCDDLNVPSKNAAKRLGFKYEGTFRRDMIYKNRLRDTSWFSMLIEEWPNRKRALQQWLDEKNFDSKGNQIKQLKDF